MNDEIDPTDLAEVASSLDQLGLEAVAESPTAPPVVRTSQAGNSRRIRILAGAAAAAAVIVAVTMTAAVIGPFRGSDSVVTADGSVAPAPSPADGPVALTFAPAPARTFDVLQVNVANDSTRRWSPECRPGELAEWSDGSWKRIGGTVTWDEGILWIHESEVTLECPAATAWLAPGRSETRTVRPEGTRFTATGSDDDPQRRPLEQGRYRLRFPGDSTLPEAVGQFTLDDSGLIITPSAETILLNGPDLFGLGVQPPGIVGSITDVIGVEGQRRVGLTFRSACDSPPTAVIVNRADDHMTFQPLWRESTGRDCTGQPDTWTAVIELTMPLAARAEVVDVFGRTGRTMRLSPVGTPSITEVLATSPPEEEPDAPQAIAAQIATPFPSPGSSPEQALGATPAANLCVSWAQVERFSVGDRSVVGMSGQAQLLPPNASSGCATATLRPVG